jgi:predicted methyltransferase MtxX (methanogen marker protein 4)
MTVWPGRIVLRFDRITGSWSGEKEITHRDRDVEMIVARLMPPWMNLTTLLHDGSRTAAIRGSFVSRRFLREVFERAGFQVIERTSWVRIGIKETS